MKNDIIIVGGGASALMLAALLPKNRAIVLESNTKLAAKVHISGGGKCNITNMQMGTAYYLGDASFVKPVLKQFDEKSLLQWLERQGLSVEVRKKSQYFCKNSAKDLVNLLSHASKHQTIKCNEKVIEVTKKEGIFSVQTESQTYRASKVVVASGGLSFPLLGASGIGYEIAKTFGHTIVNTAPALVGFTVQKEQFFFKTLSGLSTDVTITVEKERCTGAMLFTHKGLSGPAVLDASLYWKKGKITIDFLGDFSLKAVEGSKKQISSLLPLPKRLTKAFLVELGLKDKAYRDFTQEERAILGTLNAYTFAPAGTFGYTKAEVTKGGVETSEVDAQTMMSKKEEGLYFLGEVLDVTGRLGGYNFQWAFSSAYCCAKAIKKGKE